MFRRLHKCYSVGLLLLLASLLWFINNTRKYNQHAGTKDELNSNDIGHETVCIQLL